MAAPEEFDREEFEKWLAGHDPEIAVGMAARAALRVAPLWVGLWTRPGADIGSLILSLFRGAAVPWVAGTWPTHRTELRASASAAASASSSASAHAAAASASPYADAAAAAAADAADTADTYASIYASASPRAAPRAAARLALIRDRQLADEQGATALMAAPLWPHDRPRAARRYFTERWEELKASLLALDENWEVWTDWYEARLDGKRPWPESLELARVGSDTIPWDKGPAAVNAAIKALEDNYKAQIETDLTSPEVKIPPLSVNGLQPEWVDGKLRLKRPRRTSLAQGQRPPLDGFRALREHATKFVADVLEVENIDKRPALYVQNLITRFPDELPTTDELERLFLCADDFDNLADGVAREWPNDLAARFKTLAGNFQEILKRFSQTSRLPDAGAEAAITQDAAQALVASTEGVVKDLASEDLKPIISNEVPEALAESGRSIVPHTDDLATLPKIGPRGHQILLASLNNVLKTLAQGVIDASKSIGKWAREKAAIAGRAAKDRLNHEIDDSSRFLVKSVGSIFRFGAGLAAYASLAYYFPNQFGWLTKFLQFLASLPL